MMMNLVATNYLNADLTQVIAQSCVGQSASKKTISDKGRFILSKNGKGEDIYEWIDCHFDELSSWKLWEILGRYYECNSTAGNKVAEQIESALKLRGDFNNGVPWMRPSQQLETSNATAYYQ